MLILTLYTKADCTLCDHVKNYLTLRQRIHPHQLIEVDITNDPDLFAHYRFAIPILECGDTRLKAPISNGDIERILVHSNVCHKTESKTARRVAR